MIRSANLVSVERRVIMNNGINSTGQFNVRRASIGDIKGIMDVACSVGNSEKIHSSGFLMDDYIKDYDYFKQKFENLTAELEHFYVIEDGTVFGFLIAYNKKEWLRYNQGWDEEIIWSPDFDKKHIENFILVDKTAILKGYTGKGLGSLLYKRLIQDVKNKGIEDMFAETIISPKPNFASLEFRIKQNYKLAGIRYEQYKDTIYTDLVYHKKI